MAKGAFRPINFQNRDSDCLDILFGLYRFVGVIMRSVFVVSS